MVLCQEKEAFGAKEEVGSKIGVCFRKSRIDGKFSMSSNQVE